MRRALLQDILREDAALVEAQTPEEQKHDGLFHSPLNS